MAQTTGLIHKRAFVMRTARAWCLASSLTGIRVTTTTDAAKVNCPKCLGMMSQKRPSK